MIKYDNRKLENRILERYKTKRAFARALGVSEGTLSAWLRNKRQMTCKAMQQMIELLEIPDLEIEEYFFHRLNTAEREEAKTEKEIRKLEPESKICFKLLCSLIGGDIGRAETIKKNNPGLKNVFNETLIGASAATGVDYSRFFWA